AAVTGRIDPRARPAALPAPGVELELPHPGEQDARVVRVHGDVRGARVPVHEQHPLPRLAAVRGAVDAALFLGPVAVAEGDGRHAVPDGTDVAVFELGESGVGEQPLGSLLAPHLRWLRTLGLASRLSRGRGRVQDGAEQGKRDRGSEWSESSGHGGTLLRERVGPWVRVAVKRRWATAACK